MKARFILIAAEGKKEIFSTPRGVKMNLLKYASKVRPDTRSTMRPTQSRFVPYSQTSPG
jgi:hypothetical protein